jgi:tetratricopeptide (TPR) repeat protein
LTTDTDTKGLFENAMSEILKNNYGKSIELLDRVIDRDAGHKLAIVARGTACFKMGNPAQAIEDFSRAIQVDSQYARAYHMRGLAREKLGDDQEALKDFDKALDCNPEYGPAYYSRATLNVKLGREDAAVQDMAAVSHLTNFNIESYANENNVWRSQQMRVESLLEETDLSR